MSAFFLSADTNSSVRCFDGAGQKSTCQLGLETRQAASFHMRLNEAFVAFALVILNGRTSLASCSSSPRSEQAMIHILYSPGINMRREITASTLTRPDRDTSNGSL